MQRWLWPSSTTNFAVSASAATLQETLPESPSWPVSWGPTMAATSAVQAHYAGGNSAWSASVPLEPDGPFSAALVAGQQGLPYLAIANLPSTATALRVTRIDEGAIVDFGDTSLDTQWDIPVSQSANGVYAMPTNAIAADSYGLDDYQWWVQTVESNNGLSAGAWLSASYNPATNAAWMVAPFFDGRQQMKQNLNFLLRVANAVQTFGYTVDGGGNPIEYDYPTNYAFAALYDIYDQNTGSDLADLNQLRPFQENNLYRNFVFSTDNLNPDGTLAGVGWGGQPFPVFLSPPAYQFQAPSTSAPIPAILASAVQQWTCNFPLSTSGDMSLIDVTPNSLAYPSTFYMTNTQPNYFGLPFLSAHFAYTNDNGMQFSTLYAGGSIPAVNGGVFAETATPGLTNVGYYFARPYTDPVPGQAKFSSTDTTAQPMIVGFTSPDPDFGNQPFEIAGYAKLALTNGYPNVFGYLGQYFEQALVIGTNGVTSNSAGFLSAYGDFFPTVPGPAALVTMPDIETGQRGTGVVNVIKLQLDVNHDGVMDLSYGGPDNTWEARPFVFWVNNDHDWSQSTADPGADLEVVGPSQYDYNSTTIPSERDLEDWARLWVCGVPAVASSQGCTVTLSFAPTSGNPAINLINAVETNGGTLYLTDNNTAYNQTYDRYGGNRSKYIRITPSTPLTLPAMLFTNAGNKYFLFEGAGVGAGQLMLTIAQVTPQGTNVLAQTSAWLDLRDVKDLFEHVKITGITNTLPGDIVLSSSYAAINPVPPASDEDTNMIVFVHGWRMGVWDYNSFSETMFKRLYWQGFHGRFVSVRWPTLSRDDFQPIPLGRDYFTYNSSEFRAWKSGMGLSSYLTSLKQRFPTYSINVCAHSMGNIVMLEALKRQFMQGQQTVRNYVLMQAAVPASCYDTSFTNYALFITAERSKPTPDTYRGYAGAINGALSGHIVDFYNTNDYALATGALPWPIGAVNWEANQLKYKPDGPLEYDTDGSLCYNTSWSPARAIDDDYEIMAFCARPRSKAVGAQIGVSAAIFAAGQVDLHASFGFDRGSDQHSAQFNWPIQLVAAFYRQLGVSLGVLQAPTP